MPPDSGGILRGGPLLGGAICPNVVGDTMSLGRELTSVGKLFVGNEFDGHEFDRQPRGKSHGRHL